MAKSRGARNERRVELGYVLARGEGMKPDAPSRGGVDTVDRVRGCRIGGLTAWVGLAAVALLLAASAVAADVGSLQSQVNEVLSLTPNVVHGAEIFRYCAGCHASPSNGLPEGWVPNITGQHPRYLAKQLIDYRHSIRWDVRMEPVAKGHGLRDSQDMADVVAFLAAQPADWSTSGDTAGEHTAARTEERRFYRGHCGSCHGLSGGGNNARSIPRIAGQDFAYLLRQMHDVVDGRRANMRAHHLRDLENLDVLQLVSLSRYIAHLGAGDDELDASELTGSIIRQSSVYDRELPALREP